jgi:HSP20 family protein
MVVIKGEKKSERVEDTEDYYLNERSFGSFVRSVEMPDAIDSDSIKAEQKDGVLTIQLKKRPGAGQKKIPVAAK